MQSLFLFIGIIFFFILALTISNYLQRRKGNTREREAIPPAIDLGGGCCGAHEVCERNSLIAAFAEEPEYFDDEELDQYAHRDSARYAADEIDEFREIFYSLLDEEKPCWIRSLQVRDISLPDQLKDEVLLFVRELRAQKMHA